MKTIAYITGFCFTLACFSCNRDGLYYATEEQGFVRLNVNWQPAQLEPNGMSVWCSITRTERLSASARYAVIPTRWISLSPWGNSTCWLSITPRKSWQRLASRARIIWRLLKPVWRRKRKRYTRTCFQKPKELREVSI